MFSVCVCYIVNTAFTGFTMAAFPSFLFTDFEIKQDTAVVYFVPYLLATTFGTIVMGGSVGKGYGDIVYSLGAVGSTASFWALFCTNVHARSSEHLLLGSIIRVVRAFILGSSLTSASSVCQCWSTKSNCVIKSVESPVGFVGHVYDSLRSNLWPSPHKRNIF